MATAPWLQQLAATANHQYQNAGNFKYLNPYSQNWLGKDAGAITGNVRDANGNQVHPYSQRIGQNWSRGAMDAGMYGAPGFNDNYAMYAYGSPYDARIAHPMELANLAGGDMRAALGLGRDQRAEIAAARGAINTTAQQANQRANDQFMTSYRNAFTRSPALRRMNDIAMGNAPTYAEQAGRAQQQQIAQNAMTVAARGGYNPLAQLQAIDQTTRLGQDAAMGVRAQATAERMNALNAVQAARQQAAGMMQNQQGVAMQGAGLQFNQDMQRQAMLEDMLRARLGQNSGYFDQLLNHGSIMAGLAPGAVQAKTAANSAKGQLAASLGQAAVGAGAGMASGYFMGQGMGMGAAPGAAPGGSGGGWV